MEMGVELDAVNGDLHGVVLPSVKFGAAFVDSPELRVEVQAGEQDFLVFRMKYFGLCDAGMISLERNAAEPSVDPGARRERTVLHDPVRIPFKVRANALDSELYYIPIWKHVIGTVHRVRFHPCVTLPTVDPESVTDTVPSQYGQTFQIDWVAFAKAPVVTKVRGCIDQYFQEDDETANLNCTEHSRHTNGIHRNSAFECFPMALPLASTYNCRRDGGGHRLSISGKHFGKSDAIVTVDGVECLDVVHVEPETELQCTLPPASSQWLAAPTFPSAVRVHNGQLHELFDDVPLLSYAAPVSARPTPSLSNVAAHALDVNWLAPSSVWEAMTVTGYRVSWKLCSEATYAPALRSVVVGNVTSTTIIDLLSSTSYQVTVAALTEDYRERATWQDIDLYGRRDVMPGAVLGLDSPSSLCVTTLANDFAFPEFSARLLTNVSALSSPLTSPTLGPTGEIGDQGHFGLYVNGHADVQNCNASVSCCDGYASGDTTRCTYTCSETEARVSAYENRATARSPPTNAQFAGPFPAKTVRSSASSLLPAGASSIAPVSSACGPALRLTASDSLLTGSAWYPRPMNVREGFATSFAFRLSNPSTFCKVMDDVFTSCRSRGGDGFAFVVQNDAAIGVGSGGRELGYGGLRNALAVEFDTWYNPEQLDVFENHISVHVSDGPAAVQANHTFALGATSNLPDLADGDHSVRIVYDPVLDDDMIFTDHFVASTFAGRFFASGDWRAGVGSLAVFLDNMDTPVVSVPLRLEHSVVLHHGRAYVGFTAATGESAWQTHDILQWQFTSLRRRVPAPVAPDI
ncbi:hypothetical protein PybrP1_004419 [[Pythium] brassicae (nom. inval.)]|nr:hypothetical protein PybrP1_004419 [[Pythium] brassicae (nom. inval.)]